MKRPISPRTHGLIDYSTAAATMAVPRLLGFPPTATAAAYGVAGSMAGLSSLTDFRPALKRVVPLKVHALVDTMMSVAVPALPWVLGFAGHRRARGFFLGLTAMTGLVTLLTNWKQGG
jgi:hypothetical protein